MNSCLVTTDLYDGRRPETDSNGDLARSFEAKNDMATDGGLVTPVIRYVGIATVLGRYFEPVRNVVCGQPRSGL